MTQADGKDVPERTDKRITCPVCKGRKDAVVMAPDDAGYQYAVGVCTACDGEGEVCVCPVCEGAGHLLERDGEWVPSDVMGGPEAPHGHGARDCGICGMRGYVKISEWDEAVDEGHKRLMEEHGQDTKDKAKQEQDDIANLVVLHRMAMNALATEWEKLCKRHEMHTVDAGAFGRVLGGMTVAYFATMEDELGIERHQVFARFVNGMLHYMETRGDSKGVGVVAGQSAECREGMRAMAAVKGDKEMMN